MRRLTDAKRTEPTDGAAKLVILTDGLTFPLSAHRVPARFSTKPPASYNSGVGTARPSGPPVSTTLLFHPTPDATYGFPNARRLAHVASPHQQIEVWETPQLGRLFTL
ncbi:polyamine aminopropyltransferase, partial [Burkholderia cenocepacia]|nr:polyamine aminopropyltransferase [Burkholderia cenocepacia]